MLCKNGCMYGVLNSLNFLISFTDVASVWDNVSGFIEKQMSNQKVSPMLKKKNLCRHVFTFM